jgi:acetolactate synthase-1/2/3 large subunit
MVAKRGRSAAALLVECLASETCEYVFSVPGEETMDVLEAISEQTAVRHVTTRHEQGAAFMADAYGRLTGRAAVAMATLGPGATNLVTGIADAYLDHAPMVAITGQTGLDKLHKEAHQFVDIVRMFEPVTKWNQRVEQPAAVPEIVRKAFRVAQLEKPGPTHIELPENLAATKVDEEARPLEPTRAYFPEPTDEAIAHAARLLAGSGRPLVLAGNGVLRRNAAPELRAFARELHIPVAVTFMGKGAIDDRSHLSLMAVGLQARDHVLSGFDRADLVVVANCGQRRIVSIVPGQLVGKPNQVLAISWIADIVHVAFCWLHGCALFVDHVYRWVLMMKPDGRRRSADIEHHFYSRRVHLLQDLVEPCEFKLSLGWFKGVPGKVAHAD